MKKKKNIEKKAKEGFSNYTKGDNDIDNPIQDITNKEKTDILLDQDYDETKESVVPTYNFKWMLALLLIGIIGSFLFRAVKNKEPIHHIVFTEYFETYPDIVTSKTRDSQEEYKSTMLEAMSFYNQEKYSDAISIYRVCERDEKVKSNAKFYQSISLLAKGEIFQANQILQELDAKQNIDQIDDAIQWYLALSYLRLGDYKEVKKTFEKLPASHYKFKESRDILIQLN